MLHLTREDAFKIWRACTNKAEQEYQEGKRLPSARYPDKIEVIMYAYERGRDDEQADRE